MYTIACSLQYVMHQTQRSVKRVQQVFIDYKESSVMYTQQHAIAICDASDTTLGCIRAASNLYIAQVEKLYQHVVR
jgi:hypothetical protein